MKKSLTALFLALMTVASYGYALERIVDNIDLPFVSDPAVLGEWVSVDFVKEPSDFTPGAKRFQGKLYLEGLNFLPGGKTAAPWWTWTKGVVMHSGDKTAAAYTIKELNGKEYMFFEWKSGDYTIRHQKPEYYVLKRAAQKQAGNGSPAGLTRAQGRLVDNIDLPFVGDPAVLGEWVSVDFVREPAGFTPGKKSFGGELYLEGLTFLPGGKTAKPWWTYTKGVVMHSGDHTASAYTIKELDGHTYMFFEWKSGDYTIRRQKPQYYVLEKK
ncbi:MAG: hypothetical protein NTY45_13525 [Elusimicrobia bacterium]|nr:hypothetical protein [Elusimicrobiota bacterium]